VVTGEGVEGGKRSPLRLCAASKSCNLSKAGSSAPEPARRAKPSGDQGGLGSGHVVGQGRAFARRSKCRTQAGVELQHVPVQRRIVFEQSSGSSFLRFFAKQDPQLPLNERCVVVGNRGHEPQVVESEHSKSGLHDIPALGAVAEDRDVAFTPVLLELTRGELTEAFQADARDLEAEFLVSHRTFPPRCVDHI